MDETHSPDSSARTTSPGRLVGRAADIHRQWQRRQEAIEAELSSEPEGGEASVQGLTQRMGPAVLVYLWPISGESCGAGLENGRRGSAAASGRAHWPCRKCADGLGADPGPLVTERAQRAGQDSFGPVRPFPGGGHHGGLLGSASSRSAASVADRLAMAEPRADALPAVEPLARGVGPAHGDAGDCGLVSCAWLEPTYDVGTDCLRWHLWILP